MKLSGRVWKVDDETRATDLLPARFDKAAMMKDAAECEAHCLEDLRPDFSAGHQPGDIVVGGLGLGGGHAHYYPGAVFACRCAGVSALLADRVGELFQRTAIDDGYPAWSLPGIHAFVNDGDQLELDLGTGRAINLTTGDERWFPPMDEIILDIVEAGSSFDWAVARARARMNLESAAIL